jgi:hypothetical protein
MTDMGLLLLPLVLLQLCSFVCFVCVCLMCVILIVRFCLCLYVVLFLFSATWLLNQHFNKQEFN